MTFTITLKPSDKSFDIEPHEKLLEAALKQGYNLPYSCRDGVCGVCKGKLLAGEVDYGNALSATLTEQDKQNGLVLLCCAKPLSNLELECQEIKGMDDIQIKTMPCRVHSFNKLANDVIQVKLQLPASEKLKFLAGQYISIQLKDRSERLFSLANAPHDDSFLELHIRHIPNGSFTTHVFNLMQARDIWRFKGPMGTFFLREDSDKPIIFLASGTGFAPIKSIIEHAIHIGVKRPMHLYWGGRKRADLYMRDLADSWKQQGVQFTPVLSEALDSDHWEGRTGLVHQAILDDYDDLSNHEVYVCGSPLVVDAALRDFTQTRQLPEAAFFSDAFTFNKT